jgi:hypothetical protein
LEVEGRPQCVGLGYGERECLKAVEEENSSRKELRLSPTPSWDSTSVAKYWKRKVVYSESETDMKSHNYCTHCQMNGHWRRKCWKLRPELRGTPSKKPVPKSMQMEVGSSVKKKWPKIKVPKIR